MKKSLLIIATLLIATSASAKCKKNYSVISCKEVKEAKRESFCWKGKLKEKKKEKICLTERKTKRKLKKNKRK